MDMGMWWGRVLDVFIGYFRSINTLHWARAHQIYGNRVCSIHSLVRIGIDSIIFTISIASIVAIALWCWRHRSIALTHMSHTLAIVHVSIVFGFNATARIKRLTALTHGQIGRVWFTLAIIYFWDRTTTSPRIWSRQRQTSTRSKRTAWRARAFMPNPRNLERCQ